MVPPTTDPDKTDCFGGRFGNVLTKYFLGYEVMIISSFKNLLPEKLGKLMAVWVREWHPLYFESTRVDSVTKVLVIQIQQLRFSESLEGARSDCMQI